jgi:cell division protein FtsA
MDKNTIVGLDIGTTKISVVIGEVEENGALKIVGLGTSPSDGLRKGVVVNIEKTVKSIVKAVEEAELMAGIDVREVYVGIAGRHIKSFNSRGIVAVSRGGNEITHHDVKRVIDQASVINIPGDKEIIHVIPQGYVVDDQSGIKDPIGMSGVKLEGDVHIVTGAITSAENIKKSVEKAGIHVADIVLEPIASANAVLENEEKELGVAVIDMGGGTTDIAVYIEDALRYTGCVDFGGTNVTSDVAIGLRTPMERAEEIKRKYGTCKRIDPSTDEIVVVPGVAGREQKEISKSMLSRIIRSRMAEIFQLVLKDLKRTRLLDKLGAGIVLTGGGALLPGARDLAEEIFEMPVKIGTTRPLGGLANAVASPVHATGVGLVLYGLKQLEQESVDIKTTKVRRESVLDLLKKFAGWVKAYV